MSREKHNTYRRMGGEMPRKRGRQEGRTTADGRVGHRVGDNDRKKSAMRRGTQR